MLGFVLLFSLVNLALGWIGTLDLHDLRLPTRTRVLAVNATALFWCSQQGVDLVLEDVAASDSHAVRAVRGERFVSANVLDAALIDDTLFYIDVDPAQPGIYRFSVSHRVAFSLDTTVADPRSITVDAANGWVRVWVYDGATQAVYRTAASDFLGFQLFVFYALDGFSQGVPPSRIQMLYHHASGTLVTNFIRDADVTLKSDTVVWNATTGTMVAREPYPGRAFFFPPPQANYWKNVLTCAAATANNETCDPSTTMPGDTVYAFMGTSWRQLVAFQGRALSAVTAAACAQTTPIFSAVDASQYTIDGSAYTAVCFPTTVRPNDTAWLPEIVVFPSPLVPTASIVRLFIGARMISWVVNQTSPAYPVTWTQAGCARGDYVLAPNISFAGNGTSAATPVACAFCAPGRSVIFPRGALPHTADEACMTCSPGTYASTRGSTTCAACAAGTYSAGFGATVCSSCSLNRWSPSNSSSCLECFAGWGMSRSSCERCAVGRYAPTAFQTCVACPLGTASSVVGATVCDACWPGTFSETIGASVCSNCSLGSFVDYARASTCTACPAGRGGNVFVTLQEPPRSNVTTACTPCPAGFFSLETETFASGCTACPPGTFSNMSEAAACSICQLGYISNHSASTTCHQCATGYIHDTQQSACAACEPGTFAFWGTNNATNKSDGSSSSSSSSSTATTRSWPICALCPTGTFAPSYASSVCGSCRAGTFANMIGQTACTSCASGTFSNDVVGATRCISCAPGKFAPLNGLTACTDCANGTFSPQEGALACTPCPIHTVSVALHTACAACPTGMFTSFEGKQTLVLNTCQACIAGFFLSLTLEECNPCPMGRYSRLEGTTSCLTCEQGYFANATASTQCEACAPGTATYTTAGATFCVSCPVGKINANVGASTCTECGPGSYAVTTNGTTAATGGTSCASCNFNTYSAQAGQTACSSCPAFTFSGVGATRCGTCEIGTVFIIHSLDNATTVTSSCEPCPPGTFGAWNNDSSNVTAALVCRPCSLGQYSDQLKSTRCEVCAANTYAPYAGSSVCIACEPGFVNDMGATACVACLAGTFWNGGNASVSAPSCEPCPRGLYSSSPASTQCDACSRGAYTHVYGASICDWCIPGYANPHAAATTCLICESGFACNRSGCHECTPCAANTFCPPGSVVADSTWSMILSPSTVNETRFAYLAMENAQLALLTTLNTQSPQTTLATTFGDVERVEKTTRLVLGDTLFTAVAQRMTNLIATTTMAATNIILPQEDVAFLVDDAQADTTASLGVEYAGTLYTVYLTVAIVSIGIAVIFSIFYTVGRRNPCAKTTLRCMDVLFATEHDTSDVMAPILLQKKFIAHKQSEHKIDCGRADKAPKETLNSNNPTIAEEDIAGSSGDRGGSSVNTATPVLRVQRSIGGFCTLLFVILSISGSIVMVAAYWYTPTYTHAMVPGGLPFPVRGTTRVAATFLGASPALCARMTASFTGWSTSLVANTSRVTATTRWSPLLATCTSLWTCSNCVVEADTLKVTFSINSSLPTAYAATPSTASIVGWSVQFPSFSTMTDAVNKAEEGDSAPYLRGLIVPSSEYGHLRLGGSIEVAANLVPVVYTPPLGTRTLVGCVAQHIQTDTTGATMGTDTSKAASSGQPSMSPLSFTLSVETSRLVYRMEPVRIDFTIVPRIGAILSSLLLLLRLGMYSVEACSRRNTLENCKAGARSFCDNVSWRTCIGRGCHSGWRHCRCCCCKTTTKSSASTFAQEVEMS